MTNPGPASALHDVVIIGGGIIGCGIARDAALRGLKVALVEKHDFGSGTTSGSTRLIHGGLRYLATGDFGLVRMDLRERETLLRIAPHLVKPLPFLLPLPKGFYGRTRLRIGMHLYDALSYDKTLPRHRILGPEELRRVEPALDSSRFHGAALFYDCQCPSPERLTIENAIDAAEHGALIQNYTEVVGAIHENGRLVGVKVKKVLDRRARARAARPHRRQRQRPVVRPRRRTHRVDAGAAPPHDQGRPHRLRAVHQPRDLPGIARSTAAPCSRFPGWATPGSARRTPTSTAIRRRRPRPTRTCAT